MHYVFGGRVVGKRRAEERPGVFPSGLPTCWRSLTLKKHSVLTLALLLAAAAGLRAQTVTVDKNALNFSAAVGGAAVSQGVSVTSSTGSAISFVVQTNSPCGSWLKVNPMSGTTPSTITVTADPTGLAAGPYNGCVITVVGFGSAGSTNVNVSFTVGTIAASPSSLQFSYTVGGGSPPAQSVTLSGQAVTFSTMFSSTTGGNWLQVTPAAGTVPGAVSAMLNTAVATNLAVGTYSGSIAITPASGPAITVPVTLTVSQAPPVTISVSSLNLTYQPSGANNSASQTFTLSTTSTQNLAYFVTSSVLNNPSNRNWIVSNPTTGTIPQNGSTQVTISYDATAGLPVGTYTGTVTVVATGGLFPNGTSQQALNVTLLVSNSPLLLVPSNTLAFTYELGGSVPAAQTFTPCSTGVACNSATGQGNVTVSAAAANNGTWLSVTPAAGATGQAFSVAVAPGNLSTGTYTGTITVTMAGAANSPQTVPVQLTVANDPVLQTNLSSLSFPYTPGQSAPAAQTVAVSTSTGAPLNYTAAVSGSGCSWLVLGGTPAGTTPGIFTASVSASALVAGTYTCNIAITGTVPSTGAAAINSLSIPVTLYVSNDPMLTITLPGNPPSPPSFTAQQNGAPPAAQTIIVGSTVPNVTLNYNMAFTTTCGGSWLLAAPLTGTTAQGSNAITVSALPGLLSAGGGCGPAGAYTGMLQVSATNPSGLPVDNALPATPMVIPVTFQVTAGTLTLSSTALTFTQPYSGTAPVAQTVNVSSSGAAVNYNVSVNTNGTGNWLAATPAAGATPGTISIAVDGSKLNPGAYTGFVTVTAPNVAGSPAIIRVNFTVTPGTISAPITPLNFTQIAGGSAPAAQTVAVSGTSGLSFTVAAAVTSPASGTWLTATVGSGTATSGTTPASVTVAVNAGSLPAGTYAGTVTVTSQGATGSPISIPVNLTVVAPATLSITPSSLNFSYTVGSQTAPGPQNVQLTASASASFTATAKTTDGASWLIVNPGSGTAGTSPVQIAIGINTAVVPTAGTYTGTVTFSSPSALTTATVNVTLQVVAIPTPAITGIQNAASYSTGAVAPGENIVIYGTGIGPATLAGLQVSGGSIATTVGNTQVFFDATPAPIIYASATQTSVMVPVEVAGRTSTQITVVYSGVKSAALSYNVVAAAPGIYTQSQAGTGPGAILNQDYSVNGPNKGAAKSSYVQVYLTGSGETTPALVTGAVNSTLKTSLLTYTATVGGVPATISYQGTAPGFVEGVMQFNIQIPATASSGPQPIVISSTSGTTTYSTQTGVTVQVQ